ncbi:MAG: hypothetical protein ACOYUZ_02830 [Patescibacteria group bacterium]
MLTGRRSDPYGRCRGNILQHEIDERTEEEHGEVFQRTSEPPSRPRLTSTATDVTRAAQSPPAE